MDCIVLDLLTPSSLSTDLSAAVDVYSDWIDACDAVAQNETAKSAAPAGAAGGGAQPRAAVGGDEEDDY